MQRIYVDFNTMMADPQRRVMLGEMNGPDGEELMRLRPGERVILYDEDLEV